MYNAEKDTYSCDICGCEMKWDAHDDEEADGAKVMLHPVQI